MTVDVTGTAVDAVRALMAATDRQWLLSIRGDSSGKVAPFAVKEMPLWQALDKLLGLYDYDWGSSQGAVVVWPALIPARERSTTLETEPAAEAVPSPTRQLLEITEPTPIEEVVEQFRPTQGYVDRRVTVDSRLRGFRLMGRVAGGDPARGIQQVAAALPAVVQGDPTEGAISMGAHMWLDRAIRGAEARTAQLQARGVELGSAAYGGLPLQDHLRSLFTAQQWSLMDIGGEGVIWFRELPLDVAELWVLTARAGETKWAKVTADQPGEDYSVDWSRPEEFLAMAYYVEEVQQSPDDHLYRVVGRHLGISAIVAYKSGGGRGI